jgi:hypothetical protein
LCSHPTIYPLDFMRLRKLSLPQIKLLSGFHVA